MGCGLGINCGLYLGGGAANASGVQSECAYPAAVDPNSSFQLPLGKRDSLDALGKKVYDDIVGPDTR